MTMESRVKKHFGPVRAVVMDWAGTAVDYGCLGPTAVFQETFAAFGVAVTMEEIRGFMGLKKIDHVRGMTRLPAVAAKWRAVHGKDPDEADVNALYAKTEPLMLGCIADHAEPIPGLLDTVDALRARGIKIGSSTGYTRPMMDVLMPVAASRGYAPDAMVCSSDVPAGRPAPYMCFHNAMALDVYPMASMIKIGDTEADVREGVHAGMWSIGFTQSGNELGLSQAEAEALPVAELNERCAAIEERLRAAGAHYVVRGIWEVLPCIKDIEARLMRGECPTCA